MADAMNFGPEWLRNLSSEGTTTGAPKYQRADYRYGREEMLALFDRTTKPPESLARLQGLFVEKAQTPVALINMTEEENRLWNRGINSDAVLRINGKVPAGPPGIMRGRGNSVDRGRGRGRGVAGAGFYYTRGNYDEGELAGKETASSERPFLRTSRSFDRSQMGERGWSERNGAEPADWNGSTSPRKEYGGMMRGGLDNWRRSRDDEDGWRQREKWSARPSWREEGTEGNGGRSSNWGRGWAEEGHHGRRGTLDEVPEWATVDSHEASGSFDASGAFHGYSSDEVEGQNEGSSRRSENAKAAIELRRSTSEKSGNDPVRRNNSESESPGGGGLARSKTAAELGPTSSHQPSPTISKSASSAALSDAQTFDRIRTLHQHFITKTEAENPVKPISEHPPPTRASPVVVTSSPVKEQPEPSVQQPKAVERERERDWEVVQEVPRLGSEENMTRMSMTVDSVVRLIEDEEGKCLQPPPTTTDMWFYRDPQGNEQGPFPTSDMFNWYMNGYFLPNLFVRRDREERYNALGDLMRLNDGRVPFIPSSRSPAATTEAFPFHSMGQVPSQQPPQPQQHALKLAESDLWNTLPQSQRDAMLAQRFLMNQTPAAPQVLNSTFTHFLHQFQQANLASQAPPDLPVSDPVRAMMLMGPPAAHHLPIPGMTHMTPPSVPHPLRNSVLAGTAGADIKKDDPVQSALSKLQSANTSAVQTEQQQPPQRSAIDSLWSGPGRPMTWTNGLTGQSTTPLWNVKSEAEILAAEQQKQLLQRAEEERHKEEKRKLEELRKKEEEERKEREAAEERRRAEEEEKKRLEQEEKLRREKEERQKMEEMRKLLEEKKKEMKRLEEAKRKEEEKERRRQAEEEKKRQEQERLRLEKEAEEERKRQEELAQQQELQRRQEEALRCLKQQQLKSRMKSWSQNPHTSASLAEIQAQEKEKKMLLQREQNVQEMLAQAAEQQVRDLEAHSRSNGFNLTWVDQPPARKENVKSLAEIQAEEHKQMAKLIEKERHERAQQQRDLPVTAGVWGGNSGLSWTNHNSSPWGSITAPPIPQGFWDDANVAVKTKVKSPQSPTKSKSQDSVAASNASKKQAKVSVKPNKLTTSRKDEATVMRLFESRDNEFTSWCTSTLNSMQATIDVPTFTLFLQDVESPFEVKEYVKMYIGESREASEFANQFLERRSKWKSAKKASVEEDDMCAPAAAITPTSALADSQDNGKKGKKAKKGKMLKVDARILGFNVTAAQNRINVGQRETWDPNS